jgi:2-keto-4-pentenoate hydratase/2-oxohepta-3-ene-1,7-dioic acid hydratase in catechol pathway
MKLATYRFDDGIGPARVEGDRLADLRTMAPDMIALIERGWGDAADVAATVPLDYTRLLAPVPAPRAFLGVGLNYRDHAAEQGRALPDEPVLFARLPQSVAPPFGTVARPSDSFDYEGELGVVMGTDHAVAGYVVVNDLTIRALAKPETLLIAKNAPGSGPFGPWITTADAVADPHALRLTTHVNGMVRQDSTTAQLHHRIPDLIAFIGARIRLRPGDIITTGSPGGS